MDIDQIIERLNEYKRLREELRSKEAELQRMVKTLRGLLAQEVFGEESPAEEPQVDAISIDLSPDREEERLLKALEGGPLRVTQLLRRLRLPICGQHSARIKKVLAELESEGKVASTQIGARSRPGGRRLKLCSWELS